MTVFSRNLALAFPPRRLRCWPLPEDERAAPLARHELSALLRALGYLPELVDDAALMVTELVANAVTHAKSPYELRVSLLADRIECEVLDGTASAPLIPPPRFGPAAPEGERSDAPAEGGRGLAVVRALSAGACGARPTRLAAAGEWGKVVYFSLPWPPPTTATR